MRKLDFPSFILIVIFVFVIPFSVVKLTSIEIYDDFLVYLAETFFTKKWGLEYRGFFTYMLNGIVTPFILVLGYSSWIVLLFVIPGSIMRKVENKIKILVCSIMFALLMGTAYAIPLTHYPDIFKDYELVKRGISSKIETDKYSVYTKREHGGRYYTRYTVYYLYVTGNDGRNYFTQTYPIGQDLYEYLLDRPGEKIVLNYMPNTGVFLNGQIGDIKFGSQAEEEEVAEPDEPNISEGT